MIKFLNLLLLSALFVSALFLVHMQYNNRMLFSEITQELDERTKLRSEQQSLLLKRQNLATPRHVTSRAQKELGMVLPSVDVSVYVSPAITPGERLSIPAGVVLEEMVEGHHE